MKPMLSSTYIEESNSNNNEVKVIVRDFNTKKY